MAEYVPKSEREIDALGDEAILDYIVAAREAEDLPGAKRACGLLAFRHQRIVKARVQAKTPPSHVEDVVMEVMESASRSTFSGKFIGEFRSWLKTITQRRIADFHEQQGRSLDEAILPSEHEDEDNVWDSVGVEEITFQTFAMRELADQICAQRKNQIHRAVIHLYGSEVLGFQDLDATTTAAEVRRLYDETVSEPNIHQIWRRFAVDYRAAWEAAEGTGGEPG